MASQRRLDSSEITDAQERDREMRRAIVLRDYHDQPFSERNYGAIRGLFESPSRKIMRHEGIAFTGEFIGELKQSSSNLVLMVQVPSPFYSWA